MQRKLQIEICLLELLFAQYWKVGDLKMRLADRLSNVQFTWTKPDWRDYKLNHPTAVRHVKRLQDLGLKDPWVRNYIWIYSPRIYKTPWELCKSCFFNRLPHGLAIAITYAVCQSAFLKWYNGKDSGEDPAH